MICPKWFLIFYVYDRKFYDVDRGERSQTGCEEEKGGQRAVLGRSLPGKGALQPQIRASSAPKPVIFYILHKTAGKFY
jgi:hypothetical protein